MLTPGGRMRTDSVAWAVALVAVSLALGLIAVRSPVAAVVVAVLALLACLTWSDLTLAPALALPACLLTFRPTGLVSLADIVLAGALVPALLLLRSADARRLQPLLWLGLAYHASLLPTVVYVGESVGVIEWWHSVVLVLGGLVVGWATGRHGGATLAVAATAVACMGISVAAGLDALGSYAANGAFEAVYLPGLPKNFLGNSLAVAVVVAVARPDWIRLPRWFWNLTVAVGLLGILSAQSRQALISCVAGAVVVALRSRMSRRLWRLLLVGAVPAGYYLVNTLQRQLESDNTFNSAHQRLTWFGDSIDLWQQSPVLGVGLRWWYTDVNAEKFQPPNVILEMLTSAGIVGTVGFLVLIGGSIWYLALVDARFATVGMAVITARFVQGQFDLYWVAGTAASLWIVTGIALGAQARERALAGTDHDPHALQPAVPEPAR